MSARIKKSFIILLLRLLITILIPYFASCNIIKGDLILPQILVFLKVITGNTSNSEITAPSFSPTAGNYTSAQSVTISTQTEGAILCFTLDASTPTCDTIASCSNGTLYSSPISIVSTTTIKAIACKANNVQSTVATGIYTIGVAGDTTPPTVSSTTPADNANSIATNATISIAFSEPINAATLTTITVAGACSGSLQVSSDNFATCIGMTANAPTMSSGDTVSTMTPATLLTGSTIYKIRVTTAITDYSGNSLLSVYTSTTGFTTGEPPSALTYTGSPYTYTQNFAVVNNIPTFTGTITSCTSIPLMPSGLTLEFDCRIFGTPTSAFSATGFTITASNAIGSTTANIVMTVVEMNIILSAYPATINEGGIENFNVRLSAEPVTSLTVTLSSGTASALTVSPNSITFDDVCPGANCWSTDRTLTMTGVEDANTTAETVTIPASAPAVTNALFTIDTVDNDFPCVAGPVSNKISYVIVDTSSTPNTYKAIVSNLDGSSACVAYTISATGSAMSVVKFSPDNTKLLLLHSSSGPVYHISTINVDGTGFQTLRSSATFPNWAYGAWAEWFDNNSYLYSENGHVYKSNLDGTGNGIYINYTSIGITGGSDGIGAMIRSPDGANIMFMNHGPGNTYHYLYKINSDGITGFTDLGVYTYNNIFYYSPDSSKIAYAVFSGSWQNYYANANGTGQTNNNGNFPATSSVLGWYTNTELFYFNNTTKILATKNVNGTGNVNRFTVGATEQILNLDYTLPAIVTTVYWDNATRPRITTWDASSYVVNWGGLASAVNYKIYYWTTVWNFEQVTTSTTVLLGGNINNSRKICAVDSGAVEYDCKIVYPAWRNGYPDLPSREISGSFFDDFNDASIGLAFAKIRPAQMTEGSGYLQLNQNITDMGPAVGLYYNRGTNRYMRISWKHFAHRAGNYFSASLTVQEVTLGLQWLNHGMWYYDYNNPPYDIPCYGWCNNLNEFSDNMVYSRTPNTTLSGTQIFDAWMDAEVVIDFVAGTVTSKLNGTTYPSTSIRTDWGSKIGLQFSPYGWNTGHFIRIDDLSIQSQNTPFP